MEDSIGSVKYYYFSSGRKAMIEVESSELHQKSSSWNGAFRFFHRVSVMEIEIFDGVQDLFREALFPE